jgi:hypothetical protein
LIPASTSQNGALTRLDGLAALARGLRREHHWVSAGAERRRARLYVAMADHHGDGGRAEMTTQAGFEMTLHRAREAAEAARTRERSLEL